MEPGVPPVDIVLPVDTVVPIDEPPSIVSREGWRCCQLIVNLLAVAGVVAIIIFPCIPVFVISSFTFFVYLSSCCATDLNLSCVRNRQSCMQKMRSVKNMRPLITMEVKCQHFDSATETTVVTHFKKETFEYDSFTTQEGEVTTADALTFDLVRLHVTETIVLAGNAASKFKQQSDRLKSQYRPLDYDMIYKESKAIRMVSDLSRVHWWMNSECHFFAVLFLCDWPFRMAVQWYSVKVEISMVKYVKLTNDDVHPRAVHHTVHVVDQRYPPEDFVTV